MKTRMVVQMLKKKREGRVSALICCPNTSDLGYIPCIIVAKAKRANVAKTKTRRQLFVVKK
jgi:hypothetical protein